MSKILLRPVSLIVILLLTAELPAAWAPAASPAHQAVLESHRDRQARALLAGEAGFLEPVAAEDLRLMTESQPTVFGRVNVAAYYRALLERFSVREFQRESLGGFDLGAHVVEVGRLHQRLAYKSGAGELALQGKYVEVWTKRADGELRLTTTAWNYDAPPADGNALRFPQVPSVVVALQGRVPITDNLSLELAALGRLLETVIRQHDGRTWARFPADDAILLPNNEPLRTGAAEIVDYLLAHSRHLPVFEKLDLRNDRIEASGDHVLEYASHVANWRVDDFSGVSTGKNLRIWRREPDHALKLVLQIAAYD